MTLQSELRIDVIHAYESLQTSLSNLHQSMIKDEPLIAWVQGEANIPLLKSKTCTHREGAFQILNQLEYLEDQAPREILVLPGFIGSSHETLQNASCVNDAKEHFKKVILNLRQEKISLKDKQLNDIFEQSFMRKTQTSKALKTMGLARLHLKQCYRKIPILDHAPSKISWTWAHTRSIKRITVKEAEKLLLRKKNDPGIQRQLSLLGTLSAQEPLAIVQELAPHLRSNILFSDDAPKERIMIKGPVPIFFPASSATPSPIFKPPSEKCNKKQRVIRSDVRLDPVPFLPAIRAHRYLEDTVISHA